MPKRPPARIVKREDFNPAIIEAIRTSKAGDRGDTEYLLASPRNAERLRHSIAQLEAGISIERDIIEPDE